MVFTIRKISCLLVRVLSLFENYFPVVPIMASPSRKTALIKKHCLDNNNSNNTNNNNDNNIIIIIKIKTETITETNLVLRAAGNIAAEIVGYKNKEMTGD